MANHTATNPMASNLDLSYAQVAFKASHNSYDREELPISSHFDELGSGSADGRCRGLELDLNASGRNWMWSVNHVGGYGGAMDQQLPVYLADLARWHDANPNHDVVTVVLDLKGGGPLDKNAKATSELSARLDGALKDSLKDTIFRPQDLRGNSATLLDGAKNWPSLKALTGKFIFCLSGSGDLKDAYVQGGGNEVCCFVDRSFAIGGKFVPEESPEVVFYNFDVDAWSAPERVARFKQVVRQIAADGRCITRGYVFNNAQVWKRGLEAGISILATDKVKGHDWAAVGDDPFAGRLRVERSVRGSRGARASRSAAPTRRTRARKSVPSTRAVKAAGRTVKSARRRRKGR
jgi:hypothetical protein